MVISPVVTEISLDLVAEEVVNVYRKLSEICFFFSPQGRQKKIKGREAGTVESNETVVQHLGGEGVRTPGFYQEL